MSNLTVFAGEFDGNAIRVNDAGQFSTFDVMVAFGVAKTSRNAPEVWKRITEQFPQVITICDHFQFPGKGQRKTPVADEEGIYQILMLCPGERGAEFRKFAATLVRERREEESNPELAYNRGRQRAVKAWKKQGFSDKEIFERLRAIEDRCGFTDVLKAHGVTEGTHFGEITNAIYLELFGAKAPELKEQRGLTKKQRLRDSFSRVEVAANNLVEVMSSVGIEEKNLQGLHQCKTEAKENAKKVKRIFE